MEGSPRQPKATPRWTAMIVTSITLANTIFYSYNSDGKVMKKRVQTANGTENTYVYSYSDA